VIGLYVLEGHEAKPARSAEEWGAFLADIRNRRVAYDERDGVRVSTIFLGIDHGFGMDGPPVLFETRVFGGQHDQMQIRYGTWAAAEAGHREICARVFGEPTPGADPSAE
jgi:hypothetical protein